MGDVRLVVLGQVRLLPEALSAEGAREGLLPRVRADVHVHRVLVLEALAADAAVVQGPLFPDAPAPCRGAAASAGRRRLLGVLLGPGRDDSGRRRRRGAQEGVAGAAVLRHFRRDALQLLVVLRIGRGVQLGQQQVVDAAGAGAAVVVGRRGRRQDSSELDVVAGRRLPLQSGPQQGLDPAVAVVQLPVVVVEGVGGVQCRVVVGRRGGGGKRRCLRGGDYAEDGVEVEVRRRRRLRLDAAPRRRRLRRPIPRSRVVGAAVKHRQRVDGAVGVPVALGVAHVGGVVGPAVRSEVVQLLIARRRRRPERRVVASVREDGRRRRGVVVLRRRGLLLVEVVVGFLVGVVVDAALVVMAAVLDEDAHGLERPVEAECVLRLDVGRHHEVEEVRLGDVLSAEGFGDVHGRSLRGRRSSKTRDVATLHHGACNRTSAIQYFGRFSSRKPYFFKSQSL